MEWERKGKTERKEFSKVERKKRKETFWKEN